MDDYLDEIFVFRMLLLLITTIILQNITLNT